MQRQLCLPAYNDDLYRNPVNYLIMNKGGNEVENTKHKLIATWIFKSHYSVVNFVVIFLFFFFFKEKEKKNKCLGKSWDRRQRNKPATKIKKRKLGNNICFINPQILSSFIMTKIYIKRFRQVLNTVHGSMLNVLAHSSQILPFL